MKGITYNIPCIAVSKLVIINMAVKQLSAMRESITVIVSINSILLYAEMNKYYYKIVWIILFNKKLSKSLYLLKKIGKNYMNSILRILKDLISYKLNIEVKINMIG